VIFFYLIDGSHGSGLLVMSDMAHAKMDDLCMEDCLAFLFLVSLFLLLLPMVFGVWSGLAEYVAGLF
jgi:hypothetical protein